MAQKVGGRVLDALPDTVDFRDAMYLPSLIRVPPASDIAKYRKKAIPVLDQGSEGACTGFALATIANYLLRARGKNPDAEEVSAWMLYAMAKRYDEWPGEDYSGSSARGVMKGWHKHGICAMRLWQDLTGEPVPDERAADAIRRPLGAYYRVNHRDLVAMHAAITEVGVLLATADVHEGWQSLAPGKSDIVYSDRKIGGHAFAIVGYDDVGFWIQNSWGTDWGKGGLARIGYDDWLENGSDVWVASLGVPISLKQPSGSATLRSSTPLTYQAYVYSQLRPHIITARNDGILDLKGAYGLTEEGLRDILTRQMMGRMAKWGTKRVLLYAHGGLVSETNAVQAVADYRQSALDAEVYPIAFIWRSDAWSTIANILKEAFSRRRDEGLIDRAKDFLLDRIDDMLEPVARVIGGKAMWDEMKENAFGATQQPKGAARLAADLLIDLAKDKKIEIHLAGHSAGSIFLAPLARYLTDAGVQIHSASLLAPACTMDLFDDYYRGLVENGKIARFGLYTLDDVTERADDCAHIYNKSLLCLVSAAFEATPRIPWGAVGEPLLGLERFASGIENFWDGDRVSWIKSPASPLSDARHHGDFDNDSETLRSTLARICERTRNEIAAPPAPSSTPTGRAAFRLRLDAALGN
ncbi:C1 family peptidase [Sphingomonas sp. JC676]|uniref:C1 family peptidase n=1 Tax=Sphingomonas sp. JC676 TaxID=2768065 RepID=UPI0016586A25|nr:C1 family peptidase [Sphingomonas sp. JC676]MBC9031629.1 C1 family peptidase [Sphingomonas sp. JC676]